VKKENKREGSHVKRGLLVKSGQNDSGTGETEGGKLCIEVHRMGGRDPKDRLETRGLLRFYFCKVRPVQRVEKQRRMSG